MDPHETCVRISFNVHLGLCKTIANSYNTLITLRTAITPAHRGVNVSYALHAVDIKIDTVNESKDCTKFHSKLKTRKNPL